MNTNLRTDNVQCRQCSLYSQIMQIGMDLTVSKQGHLPIQVPLSKSLSLVCFSLPAISVSFVKKRTLSHELIMKTMTKH